MSSQKQAAAIPQEDVREARALDNRRLIWLMNEAQIDGAVGMDEDRYSLACKLANERGRETPNEQDEADGCRAVIDHCMVFREAEGG